MIKENFFFDALAANNTMTHNNNLPKSRNWWDAGAAIGLFGGLLTTVLGLLLTLLAWMTGNEVAATVEGRIATWLLIITFPALMFGAYCLDKAKEADKKRRLERCQQSKLKDG